MYHELIFRPLYNGLVLIMNSVPGIDVGVAVILFTVVVRFILFPLSKSALLTQARMKEVEPETNEIKSKYSNDKQTQALKIMQLYKDKKIKPFASVWLLLIQIPILIGIISVFYKIIPEVRPEFLYSFVSVPHIKASLLGLDLTHKSFILALITAVAQFLQLYFSIASRQQKGLAKPNNTSDISAQVAYSMNAQMKYVFPIIAFVSTYWIIPKSFPGAAAVIAIYWSVTSLFTLCQELYISKKFLKK